MSSPGRVTLDPAGFRALILDMDGVVTDTASVHAAAWTELFDEYLATEAPASADSRPFTTEDYRRHVDGRPRIDGVRTFLAARGVTLPDGRPDDPPGGNTAWALANRKDALFHRALARRGAAAFPSTVRLLEAARAAGWRTAVVTASRNRAEVLEAAGIAGLFDAAVDGRDAAELGLAGKPDPATFLEAARRLEVEPAAAVVAEDAQAGVEAGRAGEFGLVIGVDRSRSDTSDRAGSQGPGGTVAGGSTQAGALTAAGADAVVRDLQEVVLTDGAGCTGDTGEAGDGDGTGDTGEAGGAVAAGPEPPIRPRTWTYRSYVPDEEGRRESLCALGNGTFATRGAAPESPADRIHYPGTYAAGIFDRLASEVQGRTVAHESMVNLPNWLPLTHRPEGGTWFSLDEVDILDYEQSLDLDRGLLHRRVRFRDGGGRTTSLREQRFVSMAAHRLAVLEQVIEPEDWSGTLTVRATIDGTVTNAGTEEGRRLANRHLRVAGSGTREDAAVAWLEAETVQSHLRVAVATRTRVTAADGDRPPSRPAAMGTGGDVVGSATDVEVAPGRPAHVEKVAALCTSKEAAISEPGETVLADLDDLADAGDVTALRAAHERAWAHLWGRCDLDLETDQSLTEPIVDLHVFHLLQTVSPHIADRDVGVPARGLHGEAYRGHIFWDELFVFPFLNLRLPHLTRELLLYRWRRLPAARRLARELGCRGARFPWQSGSDGTEQTPHQLYNPRSQRWMPDNSRRQHHVGLAVAWNVWQHWEVTRDVRFLTEHGAELLVEITRFFVDLAEHDPADGRWHLRGVMGPDEYHDGYPDRPGSGLDDNAYTNVLVAWLLGRAADTYRILGEHHCDDLWERLALDPAEPERWEEIRRRLAVPFLDEGVIAQFDGWDRLKELDWDRYRETYGNIGRLDLILESEGDDTNHYKLAKQADALMLLYLFSIDELVELLEVMGYRFDRAAAPRMVDYYLARTADGSTLSRVAHSWVLARANRPRSWPLLLDALQADVADTQGGTTAEGIHLGAMAGTVDMIQRGYSGIEARGGTLYMAPRLPDGLDRVSFDVTYRGHWLHVDIDHHRLVVTSRPGGAEPVRVGLGGERVPLQPGETREVALPR